MSFVELIFLLAAAHGIVLAVALIFSKKKANWFIRGLVLVLSIALLHNAVLVPVGYYAQPKAFPVWMFFAIYLSLPFFIFVL